MRIAPFRNRVYPNEQNGLIRSMQINFAEKISAEPVDDGLIGYAFPWDILLLSNDQPCTSIGEIFQYFPYLLWPRKKGQSMLFDALPFQDLQKHPEGGISLAGDFFDFHGSHKSLWIAETGPIGRPDEPSYFAFVPFIGPGIIFLLGGFSWGGHHNP
jgi:hypothetical protein